METANKANNHLNQKLLTHKMNNAQIKCHNKHGTPHYIIIISQILKIPPCIVISFLQNVFHLLTEFQF